MSRAAGFTLTELIMVIVILAVVSTISVRFIQFSTQGAIDTAERQQMAAAGGLVSEILSRELRDALPTSLRRHDGGRCLEFIPILEGGRYEASLTEAHTEFTTRGRATEPRSGRVAVYPYTASPYAPDSPGSVSVEDAFWEERQVRYAPEFTQRFAADSPTGRFFMLRGPVTVCLSATGGRLQRYSGYALGADFNTGERQIMAAGFQDPGSEPVFRVDAPSLNRNALVVFDLRLKASRGAETYQITQEVQIRNVP